MDVYFRVVSSGGSTYISVYIHGQFNMRKIMSRRLHFLCLCFLHPSIDFYNTTDFCFHLGFLHFFSILRNLNKLLLNLGKRYEGDTRIKNQLSTFYLPKCAQPEACVLNVMSCSKQKDKNRHLMARFNGLFSGGQKL